MKAPHWSRRTLYLAAAVAIVASTSGFALASVLSPPTTIGQQSTVYGGQNSAVPGWGSPTLQPSMTPSAVAACTGPSVTDAVSGSVVNIVVSAFTGATNCTASDYAEEFTMGYTATIATTTDNLTIYSQMGANPVQINYVHLILGTGVSGGFTATVNLYVDYGQVMPPMGGISVLELGISHL